MFDTVDTNPISFNPATSFLQDSYQQSMYGSFNTSDSALQGQFTNVLNSMQAGVTTNAQQGNIGTTTGEMTPQQVAAQMNVGGVMSVLPMLGNSFLPKLMFPIAGLWSLASGVKAIGGFISGARAERVNQEKFDPSQLAYNQNLNEMYEVSQRWSHLGPFVMD